MRGLAVGARGKEVGEWVVFVVVVGGEGGGLGGCVSWSERLRGFAVEARGEGGLKPWVVVLGGEGVSGSGGDIRKG